MATVTIVDLGIDPTAEVKIEPMGPDTEQPAHTPVTAVLSTQPTVSSCIV